MRRLEPEGAIANLEARLRGADGREIWVLMNIAEALEAGEARFEEHVLDIPDPRRAEDARRPAGGARAGGGGGAARGPSSAPPTAGERRTRGGRRRRSGR